MSIQTFNRRVGGFTLVEVVVVLGVVLLLAAIAVPMVNGYIEDGRRTRAQSEIKSYTAAVLAMSKDTGRLPNMRSNGAAGLYVVYTGPRLTANPFNNSTPWNSWAQNGTVGDQIDNHLYKNRPQNQTSRTYPTTGETKWRGPYLPGPSGTDPWGRPYVMMVLSDWNTSATNYKKVFFLSAGPNGRVDTNYRCRETDELAGDDIGWVVKQRQ